PCRLFSMFFFQAEDGIRYWSVTGVQTCALPISALQLPPASKVQGGAGDGCDGYGVFDPRDLGSKPQQGSTPTRYGSVESLRRLEIGRGSSRERGMLSVVGIGLASIRLLVVSGKV